MYHFSHPNVLTTSGICLDGGPAPYIIMPFMANGSLLAYLKKNRGTLVVSHKDKGSEEVFNISVVRKSSCPCWLIYIVTVYVVC